MATETPEYLKIYREMRQEIIDSIISVQKINNNIISGIELHFHDMVTTTGFMPVDDHPFILRFKLNGKDYEIKGRRPVYPTRPSQQVFFEEISQQIAVELTKMLFENFERNKSKTNESTL